MNWFIGILYQKWSIVSMRVDEKEKQLWRLKMLFDGIERACFMMSQLSTITKNNLWNPSEIKKKQHINKAFHYQKNS